MMFSYLINVIDLNQSRLNANRKASTTHRLPTLSVTLFFLKARPGSASNANERRPRRVGRQSQAEHRETARHSGTQIEGIHAGLASSQPIGRFTVEWHGTTHLTFRHVTQMLLTYQ